MSKILIVGSGLIGQALAARLVAAGMDASCSNDIPNISELPSAECDGVATWEPLVNFRAKLEAADLKYRTPFEPEPYRGYMGRKRRHK